MTFQARRTGSRSLVETGTCGPSLSFVAVVSLLVMVSTGPLTVQKTMKRRRILPLHKTVANQALHPLSATQIRQISRTVTSGRNNATRTLVAHKTTKQLSTRISKWLNNVSPITKEGTLLRISPPTLQPNKGTTRSSRCISSIRIRLALSNRMAVPISTLRLWRTRLVQPSSVNRSTDRRLRSNKLNQRMQGVAAQWRLPKHQLRNRSRVQFNLRDDD